MGRMLNLHQSTLIGGYPSTNSGFSSPCEGVRFTRIPMASVPSAEQLSLSCGSRSGLACRSSSEAQESVPRCSRKDETPARGVSEVIVRVLGGGQLGRMLCQVASQMAIKVIVLDPL